jgi:hypothetical protein
LEQNRNQKPARQDGKLAVFFLAKVDDKLLEGV